MTDETIPVSAVSAILTKAECGPKGSLPTMSSSSAGAGQPSAPFSADQKTLLQRNLAALEQLLTK